MLSPGLSDKEFCRGLLSQDKEAFNGIYERYWKRLYLYAFKVLGDQEACEDIVQEVFVKIWENAAHNEILQLENYLFRAVRYRISNTIRNLKETTSFENVVSQLPLDPGPDKILECKETLLLIEKSVGQLPRKCKEVFMMSREKELSNREIAKELKISVRTVEAQIYKALKMIKIDLGDIYFWLILLMVSYNG